MKAGRLYAWAKTSDPASNPEAVVRVKAADLRKWHSQGVVTPFGTSALFTLNDGRDAIVPLAQIISPWGDWLDAKKIHVANLERKRRLAEKEMKERDRLRKRAKRLSKKVWQGTDDYEYSRNLELLGSYVDRLTYLADLVKKDEAKS